MAAGSTYSQIASTTLSGSGTFSFTSIPQTYTNLRLVIIGTSTGGNDLAVRFNNDTAANYSLTYIGGNGSSAVSGRGTSLSYIDLDQYGINSSTDIHHYTIDIPQYQNTITYKTSLSGTAETVSGYLNRMVGLWRSTAAINRVDVFTVAGSMSSGTVATLYGIKGA